MGKLQSKNKGPTFADVLDTEIERLSVIIEKARYVRDSLFEERHDPEKGITYMIMKQEVFLMQSLRTDLVSSRDAYRAWEQCVTFRKGKQ